MNWKRPPFQGKSVLVTGAGGSIGSQLCNEIMRDDPRRLTLVSLTEAGLYTIERTLRKAYSRYRGTELVPVLGDYGDPRLMADALVDVDIVVHAGAHKHVPICELNPLAAIANNVLGTRLLMGAAMAAGVRQFCAISTDKAVRPASVMGATKRVVELLCDDFAGVSETQFFVCRFGNVMDSAGSVLPLWREQIAEGGPVTLTDERCTRYFMSIPEAVRLVCAVIRLEPKEGGIFVLEMGKPRRLIDLARELIGARSIPIQVTGLRPGEKLTEELCHGGDLLATGIAGVNRIEEFGTIDLLQVDELATAVRRRDTDEAVRILWSLVECRS